MAEHRPVFPVRAMCRCLRIHPSGFYAWLRNPLSKRAREDARQTELLRKAWKESGKVYGYRKLHDDLLDQGETICPNRVARLARQADTKARIGYRRQPGSHGGKPSVIRGQHARPAVQRGGPRQDLGEGYYLYQGAGRLRLSKRRRDHKAALAFLKRAMKRYGQQKVIVTDRLRSYRAAMNVIGNAADHECGRWLNNRAENSHQPFCRREGAMSKFKDVKTLQKFGSIHALIHNHFNIDRHLNNREIFKQYRSAALAEWRQLAA